MATMQYELLVFFFNDTATTEIYTLSLHDALPISVRPARGACGAVAQADLGLAPDPLDAVEQREEIEEHTSELQSQSNLVCRLLLEKKKKIRLKHQYLSFSRQLHFRLLQTTTTHDL